MMSSIHDPIRDCGPEFGRRLERETMRFARAFAAASARASTAREAGALAQAEADRLSMLAEEDAAHARR